MSEAPLHSSSCDEADPTPPPPVSVVMATYNCRGTIEEAVQSITSQSFEDWEAMICDDGSDDGTFEWLTELAARDPRFTILRNEENRRLSFSLNRCLAMARGSLIARMDGDDRMHTDRIAGQVEFMRLNPGIDVVGTAVRRFDQVGFHDVRKMNPRPDRYSLRRGVPFVHATVMMRKSAYEALGGYTVSPRTARGQDYDLWFRFFAADLKGANLDAPLYYVREDNNAIRRRTIAVRWQSFRTAIFGFRLLRYPTHWYLGPVANLSKGLVPAPFISVFRRLQSLRAIER